MVFSTVRQQVKGPTQLELNLSNLRLEVASIRRRVPEDARRRDTIVEIRLKYEAIPKALFQ